MVNIAALGALAVVAVSVATAGVGMIDQRPVAGPVLMWTGISAIVAVECLLPFLLLQ